MVNNKFIQFFGVGVVLLFVLSSILFIFSGYFELTGRIIQLPQPSSCEVSELGSLWEEIFVESSSEVSFFVNESSLEGECSGYFGYKTIGNDVFVMLGSVTYYRGRVTKTNIGYYINSSDVLLGEIQAISEYNSENGEYLANLVDSRDEEIVNRSVPINITSVDSEKDSYFKIEVDSWEEVGPYFYFKNESVEGNISLEESVGIWKNISLNYFVSYLVNNTDYVAPVAPFLTSNISNYTIEWNSSWVDLFDIDDYFDGGYTSCYFQWKNGSVWVSNDYENINLSIENYEVSFKPDNGFLGNEIFRIWCGGPSIVSNEFYVFVVENINDKPILKKNFDSIAVPKGDGINIFLDVYFVDPDGDNLTYRFSGDENLNISVEGSTMTIKLGVGFNYTTNFKIYASDGEKEVGSNNIYVYEWVNVGEGVLVENISVEVSVNDSVINESSSGGVGGVFNKNIIIIWSGVGIGVLLLVLFCIWFFILRRKSIIKKNLVQTSAGLAQNQVDSYLQNLNLSK